MGKFTKKLQAHDSSYNDFFKNELGKALTDVDVSLQDDTISKKSENARRLKLSYGEISYNSEGNFREEKIVVTALPGADFITENQFMDAISSQISGNFVTHDLETTLPYRSQLNNQAQYFYSLKSKYNYYARGFEEQVANVTERIAPNYYIQRSNLDPQKSNFSTPNKEFFQSIGTRTSMTMPSANDQKLRNIIVDDLQSVESTADQYPMYNEIKFVSSEVGNLTKYLNDQGMMALLMSDYTNPANLSRRQFNLLTSTENSQVTQNANISTFNLSSWIQNQNFDLATDNLTVVSGYERDSFYAERLKKFILNGIIRTYTQRYLRTYEDIINTEPCYAEVMFYKVDKYVNNIIGDPVQTYWVSNKDQLNILMDTQIKYGQPYSYDVKQVVMVVGNSYNYSNPIMRPNAKQFTADITVTNRPSIQVLEIPYFSDKIVSIQSPPLIPQVHFSTKMNSDKSIKISLSHTLGEDIQPFKTIETADLQQLDFMNLFRTNYTSMENEYFFSSEGIPEYYEVYRLDKKPMSYDDFSANKLRDAKSFLQEKRESSSHVSVNDFIFPNRKYYYMFRAVNIHNHKSNPTIVYEVELIQDADDSKVVVNKFDFEIPPTYMNTKKFNSLFQVEPALQQRLLDSNQPSLYNKPSAKGSLENIKLGNVPDSLWGRNFKIRIASTTTGRKIDFNINFNVKTSKTNEDFE
jgi:hypothetical protein